MKTLYSKLHAGTVKLLLVCLAAFVAQQATGQTPPGNALVLNGSTQYATMAETGASVSLEYTVEAWVRPMSTTGAMCILAQGAVA